MLRGRSEPGWRPSRHARRVNGKFCAATTVDIALMAKIAKPSEDFILMVDESRERTVGRGKCQEEKKLKESQDWWIEG